MKLPSLTPISNSSNISGLAWRAKSSGAGTLFVRFKSGTLYSYDGVMETTYHDGLGAESPGKWFREHISGNYTHKKHDA